MQRDAETTQSAKHAYLRVPEPSLQMVGSPPRNLACSIDCSACRRQTRLPNNRVTEVAPENRTGR